MCLLPSGSTIPPIPSEKMHSSSYSWLIPLLSLVGFISLLAPSISFLKWLYINFLRKPKDLKTYGPWALITGATDGIGKAFAFKLAASGLNLVLVSRDPTKLKKVSGEIQQKYPSMEIRIFDVDFAANDAVSKIYCLGHSIEDIEIGVLINNVGVTYPRAMYFHQVEEDCWMKLAKVNVVGTSYVTKIILPRMLAKGRGAIVNIGSGASVAVPSHPLYAIYAATKAYVDRLTKCIYVEYKNSGVDVQCQVPLYVSTKMASEVAFKEKPSIFMPTAEGYVEAGTRFIGREPRCSPYWAHSVQAFFASLLPDFLLDAWRLSIGLKRIKACKAAT